MRLFGRKAKAVVNGTEQLVRIMLYKGVERSAKAIVFGVPRGVQWDVEEAKRVHDETLRTLDIPGIAKPTEEEIRQVSRDAMLRYRNGYMHIPVWFEVGGRFDLLMELHGGGVADAISQISGMCVSLGGTPEAPQPLRYIEIVSEEPEKRRFVEIELIIEEDNTIRVELLAVRVEGKSIRVSQADVQLR